VPRPSTSRITIRRIWRRRNVADRTHEPVEARARDRLVFGVVRAQHRLDARPHGRIGAVRVEESGALGRREFERRLEKSAQVHRWGRHG